VFRNPPGDFAGRLIEAAGLKGRRLGGAVVSEKHANFIINEGVATAADVEGLIETVRATVEERTGVLLELEVRVLGVRAGAQS
jgi:UDP-N-acetylmuramate dehydrogenase